MSYVDIFEKHVCNHIVAKNRAINWATVIPGSHSVKSQKITKFLQLPYSRESHYQLENQHFVKRSQYIRVKNPLHKQPEKAYMCFKTRWASIRDYMVFNISNKFCVYRKTHRNLKQKKNLKIVWFVCIFLVTKNKELIG